MYLGSPGSLSREGAYLSLLIHQLIIWLSDGFSEKGLSEGTATHGVPSIAQKKSTNKIKIGAYISAETI